ncbi:DUF1428 domain-containing protein [Mesorhizobium shangrilense]|uniref:DUF1428 domain-containing protein n=1 Tax=Mesorhizobium shangrilense TaxID=460060 RepID=A0ABV2DC45_9HYPH
MSYIAGFVAAVPAANKEAYSKHVAKAASVLKEFGTTRIVEAWGDDVPGGKITDFKGAVKAGPDEVITFSWHEYPDKTAADAAYRTMMSDPRIAEIGATMPFDGQRMIIGGFTPIIEQGSPGKTDYIDGSLVPVPMASKAAYLAVASKQAAVIKEYGATRVVEAWGDDVPDGKVTDYRSAVKATRDETVVYAWIEWPSKLVRDEAWKKVIADPRMYADIMPYDNQRRIHGGFAPILDA